MTDADQRTQLLAALQMAWDMNPELRLTQLLVNVIRPGVAAPQIFYVTDEKLLKLIQSGEWRYGDPRAAKPPYTDSGEEPTT